MRIIEAVDSSHRTRVNRRPEPPERACSCFWSMGMRDPDPDCYIHKN